MQKRVSSASIKIKSKVNFSQALHRLFVSLKVYILRRLNTFRIYNDRFSIDDIVEILKHSELIEKTFGLLNLLL